MKNLIFTLFCFIAFSACKQETNEVANKTLDKESDTLVEKVEPISTVKTAKEIKEELTAKGFQTFDYINAKTQDTILMQQYFMAFLKSGPIRSQNEEEAALLQEAHLAHLGRMYEEGFADLIGPFGDNGDIRGITVYNVPTQKMADSLANLDPMVKAGRLEIEVHPWWCAKGQSLR
ncbi:YciI family protein [Formosa maritima]|uniref:YCII-related domain-containing protein n=1 Tax=Formosa maritima TaxID=2592046 RepID=A0A5D0FZZ7_9FLAO|nr:hypothetical protein [Formosa maritima]TYA52145.1 hypothetical protein FVF61_12400 [Formosa maritima]